MFFDITSQIFLLDLMRHVVQFGFQIFHRLVLNSNCFLGLLSLCVKVFVSRKSFGIKINRNQLTVKKHVNWSVGDVMVCVIRFLLHCM